ncbi:hypothetical protein [Leisingera sp. JC11]|uniref:hypothetical protein n=1 Tax=Leisingera sp. JC11 TaxID=3042469 RepID=UPI0034542E45
MPAKGQNRCLVRGEEFIFLIEETYERVNDLKSLLKEKGAESLIPEERDITAGTRREQLDEASRWLFLLTNTLKENFAGALSQAESHRIALAQKVRRMLERALRAEEFPE